MVDLELSEAQKSLRMEAQELAVRELKPYAAQWDREQSFPRRSYELLCSSGLLDITLPQRYGGRGLGPLESCLVIEQLASGCMASAMIGQMFLNGPSQFLLRHGTVQQRDRWLTPATRQPRYWAVAMTEPHAGSSATDLTTTLTPTGDGFRLDGEKCYITGGNVANLFLVFCRLAGSAGPRGIGAVVVEKGQQGFAEPEVEGKMGSRGIAETRLRFDGVSVATDDVVLMPDAESKAGATVMAKQFNPERLGNASMCLGVAQAALDDAVGFANHRKQFGRPIAEFQGLQWKIAEMVVSLRGARLLVWQAALTDDDGFPRNADSAAAKYAANKMAQMVTNEAIQIHGHRGFSTDFPLERYFRDVRGMALGGGTTEIMLNVVAADALGRTFSQRS